MGERIDSFRELKVYRLAVELQQEIFLLTKKFPKDETYSLTDQIRRSSRSIGANIAEAWHKRRYEAHFVSKLSDSDAEQAETQHWLGCSARCGYITAQQYESLLENCKHIGKMLGKMVSDPGKWRGRFQKTGIR